MPRKGELLVDLAGQRFGRLRVIQLSGRKDRRALWSCRCDCGQEIVVEGSNLRGSNTTSCGCLRREMTAKLKASHGHARVVGRSPEYESWTSMLARVRSKKGRRFRDYGARGITVAARWLKFENFLADMGPRPEGTTLDRVDNNGGYEPGNCRWATDSQQVRNRRQPAQIQADRKRLTDAHPELAADASTNPSENAKEAI